MFDSFNVKGNVGNDRTSVRKKKGKGGGEKLIEKVTANSSDMQTRR